jgi:uncharacterized coiled-coil protein SlyX
LYSFSGRITCTEHLSEQIITHVKADRGFNQIHHNTANIHHQFFFPTSKPVSTTLAIAPSISNLQMAPLKVPLPSGCGICGKKDGVRLCSGCKVMPYCGVEHQTAHRREHKSDCNRIKQCRIAMEAQEQALCDHPDDYFRHGVGRFWKILPTRPYMNARLDYRPALTFIRNVESVQAQLDVLMENLRLCRSDGIGSRDLVPSLMSRLGKDQESYDFMKWWATSAQDPQYDWGDMSLPYLDIKNANPLEPVDTFLARGRTDLGHLVALTLVKIKLYFILLATHVAPEVTANTDGEANVINGFMELKGSTIAKNLNVANLTLAEAHTEMANLKAQIRQLYDAVNAANPYFWPELMDPDENLQAAPSMYSSGSREEMQAAMMWTWQSWNETSGALELVYGVLKGTKYPDSFTF